MTPTSGAHTSVYPFLMAAIVAISSSAVLIQWSDASPLAMAFWRTTLGAALLTPGALRQRSRVELHRTNAKWFAVAGLGLGLHFATWLPSLTMTSTAASVTLVSTTPVFVALFLSLGTRRLAPRTWKAIGLAVLGSAIIGGSDVFGTDGSLAGDGLALLGAVFGAAYFVAGDRLRSSLPTATYAAITYAIAALVIGAVCVVTNTPVLGFDLTSWLAIGGMVLGPQLCGHTVLNQLLSKLGSVTISLSMLSEPIVASVMVWIVFAEVPPLGAWLGAPLVLAGLALQILERSNPRTTGTAA